jgi:hypothetical protein
MSAHRLTESPLDTAETSFRLLTTGPGSLALNCSMIAAELPRGSVCLRELRMLLTSRHVSDDTRDSVWRELVARARQSGPTWTVAAVGMAIPALRTIALSLTRTLSCGDPVDVDSAIMAGYLRAIHRVDVDLPDIRPRMCEAARCAGQHAIRYMAERQQRTDESTSPRRPWFHPDLVLIDAVADGVLNELDAELITLSRLEDVPLRTLRTVLKRHHRDLPPAQLQDSEPSSTAVDEEAHTASARSQGTPDAETATDPKGGRGTTPGSARISPNHPSVAARARRTGQLNPARHPTGCRPRRRTPSTRWIITWALAVTAATVLLVAAVATGAFAASAVPKDLNSVLNNLRNWMIGLLAGLATLMLTIGGLRYLVAGGDPGEVQKAKGALKAAAFGYALAVLAPLFVSVLKRVVAG